MSGAQDSDSDDAMDEFMDKFRKEKYKGAFNEDNWEEVRLSFSVPRFCSSYCSLLTVYENHRW